MIKQFNKRSSYRRTRDADWPDSPREISEVFEPRHAYRKLNVLVDAHLVAMEYDNTEEITKDVLLFSLLNNKLIQSYRYTDDGPPPDVKPIEFEGRKWFTRKAYKGWAVAYPFEADGCFWPVTHSTKDDSVARSAVTGNIVQIAEADEASSAYLEQSVEDRRKRRKQDMLAHQVAEQAVHADVFITDREYLLRKNHLQERRGLTVCSAEDAITLLSLYLRAQGEYIIPTPNAGIRMTFNRGLFYWIGTREVLPQSWRWFSACVYHSTGSKDDRLLGLGGSVLSRVQRSIEARDRVHIALNRATNNDTNDDALGNLDHVLMLLMGAVDASARVAHHVLGLTTQEKYAGWQNDGWVKQVAEKAPKLSGLFATDCRHRNTLQILRLLRNSVHGEALQGITFQSEDKTDTVMRLPKKDEAQILNAMDALGGRDKWGYQPFAPGHANVWPGLLVDKLTEEVVALLNSVMEETPVERLPTIEKANLTNEPPAPKPNELGGGVFSGWNRLAIRWQLGL